MVDIKNKNIVMKTPDQILNDVGIDVERIKDEDYIFYKKIRRAMDNFADQYSEWKLSKKLKKKR